MLGIAHHSPWVISVLLDRNQFRELLVTESDIAAGQWREPVEAFTTAPSDGRERVLFIETAAGLRTLRRQGFDPRAVKVAVYDTVEQLQGLADLTLVDHHNGESRKLDLDDFNVALGATAPGVPETLDKPAAPVRTPIDVSGPIALGKELPPEPEASEVVSAEPPEPKAPRSPGKKTRKPRVREPESYELF